MINVLKRGDKSVVSIVLVGGVSMDLILQVAHGAYEVVRSFRFVILLQRKWAFMYSNKGVLVALAD